MRKIMLVVMAVALALGSQVIPTPADAVQRTGPSDNFAPLAKTPLSGSLRATAVRRHVLVIVPLHSSEVPAPDEADVRAMGAAAKAFWEREVPGLRLEVRYSAPAVRAEGCTSVVDGPLAQARRVARIDPNMVGSHLVAFMPECLMGLVTFPGRGSGQGFIGNAREQTRSLIQTFGLQLGLNYANSLQCTSNGVAVSLSASCDEFAGESLGSVMGFPTVDFSAGIGGIGQALLTGRATALDAARGGTVRLAFSGRGLRAASLRTSFGTVYFSASSIGDSSPSSAIQVELAARGGSDLLSFPEVIDRIPQDPTLLPLGSFWTIPGTKLQASVIATDENGATIRVARPSIWVGDLVAPAAIMPPNGQVPSKLDWTMSWTPSPSRSIRAYFVEANGRIIARASERETSVRVPFGLGPQEFGVPDERVAFVRIVAVSSDGQKVASPLVRIEAVRLAVEFTSTAPTGNSAIVREPFTLSWALTPSAYADRVVSWKVTYGDSVTTVPASESTMTVDPAVAASGDFSSIGVFGIDASGETITEGSYYVQTTDPFA